MALIPGPSGTPTTLTDGINGARATDGSASNPSFSFINNTATGLFRGGSNILSFATGGTLAGSIDASQSWTLGTNSATFPGNFIYGKKDGLTVGTGLVGETVTANATTASLGTIATFATLNLQPGVWVVTLSLVLGAGLTTTGQGFINAYISTTIGGIDANAASLQFYHVGNITATGLGFNYPVITRYFNIGATTPVYLTASHSGWTTITANVSSSSLLRAVRIA